MWFDASRRKAGGNWGQKKATKLCNSGSFSCVTAVLLLKEGVFWANSYACEFSLGPPSKVVGGHGSPPNFDVHQRVHISQSNIRDRKKGTCTLHARLPDVAKDFSCPDSFFGGGGLLIEPLLWVFGVFDLGWPNPGPQQRLESFSPTLPGAWAAPFRSFAIR